MYPSAKLLMAFVWLFLAGCIFFWEWSHPDRPALTIWDTGVSIGWGAVVLSVYNFIRWGMAKSYQNRQRAIAHAEKERGNQLRKNTRPTEERNPDFDFSDVQLPDEPKGP